MDSKMGNLVVMASFHWSSCWKTHRM